MLTKILSILAGLFMFAGVLFTIKSKFSTGFGWEGMISAFYLIFISFVLILIVALMKMKHK